MNPTDVFAGLGGPPARPGTVHLVGGGPGDPALLTLRAAVLLATCDVVAHDLLSPPEALDLVPERAERVCVGRRSGQEGLPRAEVDALLISRARAGQAVVRLKGGDPFVFGRGGEEAAACRAAGVPVEVVPGVTSAVAVPAAAGVPLTHRSVAPGFAVVAGHEDPDKPGGHVDHAALAAFPGTLVFLMALGNVRRLTAALVAHGRDPATPAAVVEAGTTYRQRTVEATLATLADEVERAGLSAPAIAVVGDVVRLRRQVGGRDDLPLLGATVVVPRTLDRPSRLAARIRAAGGRPLEVRVMRTTGGDRGALRRAAQALAAGGYTTVVVPSPPAAAALADALDTAGLDPRALAGVRVAALGGGAVAALRERLGLRADATDLADPGPRVLLLSQDGRRDLAGPLEDAGAEVDVVAAYRTTTAEPLAADVAERVADADLVAVASSSSARHLAALLDGRRPAGRVVSIGPATTAACRAAGWEVAAEADPPGYDGLLAALAAARRGAEVPA